MSGRTAPAAVVARLNAGWTPEQYRSISTSSGKPWPASTPVEVQVGSAAAAHAVDEWWAAFVLGDVTLPPPPALGKRINDSAVYFYQAHANESGYDLKVIKTAAAMVQVAVAYHGAYVARSSTAGAPGLDILLGVVAEAFTLVLGGKPIDVVLAAARACVDSGTRYLSSKVEELQTVSTPEEVADRALEEMAALGLSIEQMRDAIMAGRSNGWALNETVARVRERVGGAA